MIVFKILKKIISLLTIFLIIISLWSVFAIFRNGPLNTEIKSASKEFFINELEAIGNIKDLSILLVKDSITADKVKSNQSVKKLESNFNYNPKSRSNSINNGSGLSESKKKSIEDEIDSNKKNILEIVPEKLEIDILENQNINEDINSMEDIDLLGLLDN